MPPRRTRPVESPVTITLDGVPIVAERGASVASALIGADARKLARSPKFHRPRAPSCMRGACDGCLMRVDGVPNVMTCLVQARDGQRIERQNVVLSSSVDVLRATDWFFPDGMNHHELLAGVPGVQRVMLGFARRVSGLGELPDEKLVPTGAPMETLSTDVLIVGGGPAGMLAAQALARAGFHALIVDEHPALGGSLLSFPLGARIADASGGVQDVDAATARLLERHPHARITALLNATAIGVLEGDDWLVDRGAGLVRIDARAVVVAPGGHDATPLFVGNDLPGVVSARAAGRLLRDGVLIGDRPLAVGSGPFLEAFVVAAAAEGATVTRATTAQLLEARGMSAVRGAVLKKRGRAEERIVCDAIVFEGPVAPSFELASQAGAATRHTPAGYALEVDREQIVRRIARSDAPSTHPSTSSAPPTSLRPLTAIGEVTGAAFDLATFARAADRLAAALRVTLENKPRARVSGSVHDGR